MTKSIIVVPRYNLGLVIVIMVPSTVNENDLTYLSRKQAVLGNHTPEQIQEQLHRQKRKCYYCHDRLKKIKGNYIYHVDHTFPLSRVAGTDIPANDIAYLVITCPTCNKSKSDKFPWEFFEGGRL